MQLIMTSLGQLVFIMELIGVAVIAVGFLAAGWHGLRQYTSLSPDAAYKEFRHRSARAIILGLEFLIAADIIQTVVVQDTFANIANLGLIIAIRIVLTFSLHLEIEGRWPWQAEHSSPR